MCFIRMKRLLYKDSISLCAGIIPKCYPTHSGPPLVRPSCDRTLASTISSHDPALASLPPHLWSCPTPSNLYSRGLGARSQAQHGPFISWVLTMEFLSVATRTNLSSSFRCFQRLTNHSSCPPLPGRAIRPETSRNPSLFGACMSQGVCQALVSVAMSS